jgi:AcrR family transcriptional regulator
MGTGTSDLQGEIVAVATRRLAELGARGTTMRDVAAACGIGQAQLAKVIGSKNELLAACLAAAAKEDQAVWRAAAALAEGAEANGSTLIAVAWAAVEDAAGPGRTRALALAELVLAARSRPTLAPACASWLAARHEALANVARTCGARPTAPVLLSATVLMEGAFAASCWPDPAYRAVARASLAWLACRLAGEQAATKRLDRAPGMNGFYVDAIAPEPHEDTGRARSQARTRAAHERMVDAAADIIEADGIAAVTNRAVATQAEVSLAATTRAFHSVHDLAYAGAVRVFERANSPTGHAATPRLTSRTEVASYIRTLVTSPATTRHINRGMLELVVAASRSPSLRHIGLSLRRLRGVNAAVMLMDLDPPPPRPVAAVIAMWASALNVLADAGTATADALAVDAVADDAVDLLL